MKLLKKHRLKKLILIILYEDENNYFFMDPKTFEQIEIKKELLAIKENCLLKILKFL